MSLGHGASIPTNGLVFTADSGNVKSYSGSGDSWKDLISNFQSTGTSTPSYFNSPTWADGMIGLTAICAINVIGNDTGYAYHPFNKWNNTSDAAFVLYHFQNYLGNNNQNVFTWYANRGGTWGAISSGVRCPAGSTFMIGVQYNSTSGGYMWINGAKSGFRNGSGALGTSTATIAIDGGPVARPGIHEVKGAWTYNRELTDVEMVQHFNALRGRYGI